MSMYIYIYYDINKIYYRIYNIIIYRIQYMYSAYYIYGLIVLQCICVYKNIYVHMTCISLHTQFILLAYSSLRNTSDPIS